MVCVIWCDFDKKCNCDQDLEWDKDQDLNLDQDVHVIIVGKVKNCENAIHLKL